MFISALACKLLYGAVWSGATVMVPPGGVIECRWNAPEPLVVRTRQIGSSATAGYGGTLTQGTVIGRGSVRVTSVTNITRTRRTLPTYQQTVACSAYTCVWRLQAQSNGFTVR